jgi:hypothetical protein
MEEFATSWKLKNIDGVWEATSEESYYKMLTAAVA